MFTYDRISMSDGYKDIYRGDLFQDLLSFGISRNHLEEMQRMIVQDAPLYYNFTNLEYRPQNVPLQKVIGFSRGDHSRPLLDNISCINNGDFDTYKLSDCFSYALNSSEQEYYLSLERMSVDDDPVKMYHYVEDDVYYVSCGGNHRTIIAKLLGAPLIHALVADAHKSNLLPAQEKLYNKYNISGIFSNGKNAFIQFNHGEYNVFGYRDIILYNNGTVSDRVCLLDSALKKDCKAAKYASVIAILLPKHLHKKMYDWFPNKRVWQMATKDSLMCKSELEEYRPYDIASWE